MAAAIPSPDEVLRSTNGKTNFQRLTRLLVSGGTTLLREIFDIRCPPRDLPRILNNPATENQLKAAKLTKPQWDCLYPSPGVYGKSTDFDVSLLFRLLRTICSLAPPLSGWDTLPTSTELILAADLARIKYYRNSVYGHVNQNMEITDGEFPALWLEISNALVRIAGQITTAKKQEWQKVIDNFLKDPLTAEDERNVQELVRWYNNDTEVKKSMEQLKTSTQEGMERLETGLKGVQGELERTSRVTETTVREEAQDIKDNLEEVRQSILDRISSSASGSQASGARLRLRLDCDTVPCSGPTRLGEGPPEMAVAQGATLVPITSFQQQASVQIPRDLSGENVSVPSAQGVLNFIAFKYFQTVDPSKPEELNGYLQYLRDVRKVLFVDAQSGSLIITVECSSLEILEGLWDDYWIGNLNEMAQKFLVTDDILKKFGLFEVKLTTTILEEEYRTCREYFSASSVLGKKHEDLLRKNTPEELAFDPRTGRLIVMNTVDTRKTRHEIITTMGKPKGEGFI